MEGIFHNAHEVQMRPQAGTLEAALAPDGEKPPAQWVGTLASKELADGFAAILASQTEGYDFEVVPV